MTEQNDWNFDLAELPYRVQLHRMALRLTRSAEGAEDLLQDTYLGEVERALTALPHAYKVVVLLSDIEGHS